MFQPPKLDANDLIYETRQRFLEIKIRFATQYLLKVAVFDQNLADRLLVKHLDLSPREVLMYNDMRMHKDFDRPYKAEVLDCLRYEGLSYARIRELLGVAPNTIAQRKKVIPQYFPVSTMWTPDHEKNLKRNLLTFADVFVSAPFVR